MKHFFLLFLIFSLSLQAQFQVNGIVKELSGDKPLPFATISSNDRINTITDVDGKFNISSKNPITVLEVSYVGFSKVIVPIEKDKKYYSVILSQKRNDLNEVVVLNENPALSIIRKVIENKNKNNPQKKGNSFEFKSYEKLIVTANPDSINGKIDSVFVEKNLGRELVKIDSSYYKSNRYFDHQ